MILQALAITAVSFAYIAAKAFQQLNVVHDYRGLVPVFTFIMVLCEVGLVGNIAVQAIDGSIMGLVVTIVAMTVGSAAGAIVSMSLHKRMRNRNGKYL